MSKYAHEITPLQVAQWLLEFGHGWVNQTTLHDTWADLHLDWEVLHDKGLLEIEDKFAEYWRIRITDKARLLLEIGE